MNFRLLITVIFLMLAVALPATAQSEEEIKTDDSTTKAGVIADPKVEPVASPTPLVDPEDPENAATNQIVSYYSNYLEEYRLGPQDIISVEVFGQCPDYCRTNVVVPPTARVSYPLLREGVFVGGRTVTEVADDITKQLEEYIIDPKVTVTLMRAGSARYAVMGKVGVPGVRIMERRISINEAILEAGGLAKGASKKKVYLARFSPDGYMTKEQVDLVAIERGKSPTIFLKPGDQVIVGEKGFTWNKLLNVLGQASAARILFGSPF
ncbi:MAG: hypothetical protein HKN33_15615 [Pyrinomonadaceae bacterium]|nr:hypothetical protein [Pyrinomonadaceae bacterium]